MKKTPFVLLALLASMTLDAQNPTQYPQAPQAEVIDRYFSINVADPYRPLENDTAAETLQWVSEQRALTADYLGAIPFRDRLKNRIASFQNYTKRGLPWRGDDGKIYFSENSGLKNQAVIYRADTLGGIPQVFLDPNILSADGTVALTGMTQSPDGRYTAYTISRSGSDWTEIFVIDNETLQPTTDHIRWAKFTDAQWHGDGFFYSAYDRPAEGKEFSNENVNHRIYYHRLGTPQDQDVIAYEDPANPYYFHSAYAPKNAPYLFVLAGGQGFTAVMVSWLAKFNPIFMIFTSFLLVFLGRGAGDISTKFSLNQSFSDILTGIILFFIIGCEFFINYKLSFRKSARKEGQDHV